MRSRIFQVDPAAGLYLRITVLELGPKISFLLRAPLLGDLPTFHRYRLLLCVVLGRKKFYSTLQVLQAGLRVQWP